MLVNCQIIDQFFYAEKMLFLGSRGSCMFFNVVMELLQIPKKGEFKVSSDDKSDAVLIFGTSYSEVLTSRAHRSALGSKAVKLDNNTMMPPAIEGGQRIAMVENCHTPMSPK